MEYQQSINDSQDQAETSPDESAMNDILDVNMMAFCQEIDLNFLEEIGLMQPAGGAQGAAVVSQGAEMSVPEAGVISQEAAVVSQEVEMSDPEAGVISLQPDMALLGNLLRYLRGEVVPIVSPGAAVNSLEAMMDSSERTEMLTMVSPENVLKYMDQEDGTVSQEAAVVRPEAPVLEPECQGERGGLTGNIRPEPAMSNESDDSNDSITIVYEKIKKDPEYRVSVNDDDCEDDCEVVVDFLKNDLDPFYGGFLNYVNIKQEAVKVNVSFDIGRNLEQTSMRLNSQSSAATASTSSAAATVSTSSSAAAATASTSSAAATTSSSGAAAATTSSSGAAAAAATTSSSGAAAAATTSAAGAAAAATTSAAGAAAAATTSAAGATSSTSSPKTPTLDCCICGDSLLKIASSGRNLLASICGHLFCNECLEKEECRKRCFKCGKVLAEKEIHPIYH